MTRVDNERALYRPEVFRYQRGLAFEEPVDERALPLLWCLVPAALLAVVYGLFAAATYQPRAVGTASVGADAATVLLSVPGGDEALEALRPADRLTISFGGVPGTHRMVVGQVRSVPCGAVHVCVELHGRVEDPPGSLAAMTGRQVPAEVRLAPRALVE
jgi:hypothetical protein